MPTKAQLDADKAREAATSIKGDMPPKTAYKSEAEKWDKDGNLIDEDMLAYETRQRAVLLGQVEPEEKDFPSKEWAKQMMPQAVADPKAARDLGPSDLSAGSLAPEDNPSIPVAPPGVDPGLVRDEEEESKASKTSAKKK